MRGTHLVAIVHNVVYSDERFKHHDPVVVLGAFDEQVGHLWDRDIGLVRTLQ